MMNKDIEIMIELQRYWDNILRAGSEIEKSENAIKKWKGDVEAKIKQAADRKGEIKGTRAEISRNEVDLGEKDEKRKQIEERRHILKTEKEVAAIDKEFNKIKSDSGAIEERLVELYDNLEAMESDLEKKEKELTELISESESEIKNLEERIASFSVSRDENQRSFDGLIGELGPAVKARYIKHIKSGNGKGIVPIEGEDICGGCNFKIPSHLSQDVSKNDKLVNCTNCGRFIYRDV